MTVQERASTLEPLGFTARQAHFLALAALVSGACCRRQYERFAGLRPGKNVREFLDGLVARGWARRVQYRTDRAHVYHLGGRSLYRVLGTPHGQPHRSPTPVATARRLMLFDAVLAMPDQQWLPTGPDALAHLAQLGIAPQWVPRRSPRSSITPPGRRPRADHLLGSAPVGLAANGTLTFLYLAVDPTAQGFERFLNDYAPLLTHVPRWVVHVVYPPTVRTQRTHAAVFDRWYRDLPKPVTQEDVRWALDAYRRLESGTDLPLDDVHRLQDLVGAIGRHQFDTWYRGGPNTGQLVLGGAGFAGRLTTHTITHRYDQFGSQPGLV